MQLIKMACPANVVLVHGEKAKMYTSHLCGKALCFTYKRDMCHCILSGVRIDTIVIQGISQTEDHTGVRYFLL